MNAVKLALFCTEVFDTLLVLGIAASVRLYKMDKHLSMYKTQPVSGKFKTGRKNMSTVYWYWCWY